MLARPRAAAVYRIVTLPTLIIKSPPKYGWLDIASDPGYSVTARGERVRQETPVLGKRARWVSNIIGTVCDPASE